MERGVWAEVKKEVKEVKDGVSVLIEGFRQFVPVKPLSLARQARRLQPSVRGGDGEGDFRFVFGGQWLR